MFDEKEFRPRWDGTESAAQVERVTEWPDIPFGILLHDPAVYATEKIWSAAVEAQWGADEAAFAALAPHGTVRVAEGSGHNVHLDAQAASVASVQHVLNAVTASRGAATTR
jgi:hypothetical protein